MSNTVLAVPALFVIYDFFYSLFHRALHHQRCVRHSRHAHVSMKHDTLTALLRVAARPVCTSGFTSTTTGSMRPAGATRMR